MKRPCLSLAASLCLLVALSQMPSAYAAEPNVTIRLRPHCASPEHCKEFSPYDADTLVTDGLQAGEALDLDLVLSNPSKQPMQSVQSWIEYDPTVLKGVEVHIADAFPLVAPGEQSFSEEKGLVKIGASNVSGGMKDPETVFARVSFQVLSPKDGPVLLRFHEFNLLGQEGRTKVLLIEEGHTINILKTRPKDLLLYFGEGAPPTTLPPPPSLQPSPSSQPSFPVPGPTVNPIPDDGFSRLQPQNLRITTDSTSSLQAPEDRVYLRWEPLTDPRVAGYNIYYGTVSGRYIQRRTVARETTGVTLRGLPVGKKYYVAVVAFDAEERETQFSFEVAVIVGDPSTATAPFTLSTAEGDGRGEDLSASLLEGGRARVPGESGVPVFALFSLAIFALLGTFLTLRSKTHDL